MKNILFATEYAKNTEKTTVNHNVSREGNFEPTKYTNNTKMKINHSLAALQPTAAPTSNPRLSALSVVNNILILRPLRLHSWRFPKWITPFATCRENHTVSGR
jgi:hypothetical protein